MTHIREMKKIIEEITIGVDLYTFVGARAPTMLSWAPPKVLWAVGTHNQSWYWHHCYGSLTRAQGRLCARREEAKV